jgi:transcriptional regulator with XRE-family HTH domain
VVVLEEKEVHLVKKVSKELGLTYKELGEKIGYSESSLRKTVSNNTVSSQLKTAIDLYLDNLKLKQELDELEDFKSSFRTFIKKLG